MSERRLVIPGDLIGEGRPGHNAYEEDGNVYSKTIGLAEEKNGILFVIPLAGSYDPKRGDGVIGRIEEVIFSKWIIDINAPYKAVLPLSEAFDEFVDLTKNDLTKFLDYDDIIFAEITSVTKTKNIQLSMKNRKCRQLRGGRIIEVTPAKVPRIIGKSGSMVEMIKEMTGTQIVVGQNGLVWVKGENEDIAAEIILEIERKSHVSGLTDHIKATLEERIKAAGITVEKPVKRTEKTEEFEKTEKREEDDYGTY